jgi:AcrR family transcriptional regulator
MSVDTVRKKAPERKAEILNAALDILAEQGIHALSMRSIGERVGVTDAALYRHFQDKSDIVTSLVDMAFGLGLNVDGSSSGREWFLRTMESRLSSFETDPRLVSVLFHEEIFRAYPEAGKRFDQRRREMAASVAARVRALQTAGEAGSTDPDTFALIYMGAMRMAVLEWERSDGDGPLVARSRAIMRELGRLLE